MSSSLRVDNVCIWISPFWSRCFRGCLRICNSTVFKAFLVEHSLTFNCFQIWQLFFLCLIAWVKAKLYEEYGIEKDRADRQNELDKVESSCLKERFAKSDWVECRLRERERSTTKVKDDILNRESFNALASPVQIDLGQVFDKGDCSFCITHDQECISCVGEGMTKHFDTPVNEDGEITTYKEDDPEFADWTLISTLIHKNLRQLDWRKGKCVKSEDQVLVCNL